jgi:hypothetical protein
VEVAAHIGRSEQPALYVLQSAYMLKLVTSTQQPIDSSTPHCGCQGCDDNGTCLTVLCANACQVLPLLRNTSMAFLYAAYTGRPSTSPPWLLPLAWRPCAPAALRACC